MSIFRDKKSREATFFMIGLVGLLMAVGLGAQLMAESTSVNKESNMVQTTILIQKRDLSGALGLFAPEVGPEAEVFFRGDGFRVVFPIESPFEGSPSERRTSFVIPQDGITKQVRSNADLGEYVLYLESPVQPKKQFLQLTVASEGISHIGFIAQGSPWAVRTRFGVKQSEGQPFNLQFEKSVAIEPATIRISRPRLGLLEEVSLGPEERKRTVPFGPPLERGEVISIDLVAQPGLGIILESGGTEGIDILVES